MEQSSEFTGDLDDVHQEESAVAFPIAPVRVQQDGPVQVHSVPSISGGSRSFSLVQGDAKRVANLDPRRRKLTLIASVEFYVGETANEVQQAYSAWWPANTVCEITHQEEVYVSLDGDGTLSVMSENWAS